MNDDELTEQAARVIYGVTNPPQQRRPWPSPVDAESHAVFRAEREYYLRFARALADAGMLRLPAPAKTALELANEGVAIAAKLGTQPRAEVPRCPEHGLTHAEHQPPQTSDAPS